jgi:hypothetical protein
VPLQTALAAETHLAEELALKLRFPVKVRQSVIDLLGMRRLSKSTNKLAATFALKT